MAAYGNDDERCDDALLGTLIEVRRYLEAQGEADRCMDQALCALAESLAQLQCTLGEKQAECSPASSGHPMMPPYPPYPPYPPFPPFPPYPPMAACGCTPINCVPVAPAPAPAAAPSPTRSPTSTPAASSAPSSVIR
ncbi:hypothetical protein [Pseudomonas japonica]|uniref:hypothetical protein n=1 Tax=Pseudomonas japonica TaxID=256466 RepID=UPI0015E2F163|nr:hypothetical protein [Pseudomonas japonica]MBA1289327.1 hypothetical protein [Pseudomonas japonica]